MTAEALARSNASLCRRIGAAEADLADARIERAALYRQAHEAGMSTAQIAAVTGLTRGRVWQIISGRA